MINLPSKNAIQYYKSVKTKHRKITWKIENHEELYLLNLFCKFTNDEDDTKYLRQETRTIKSTKCEKTSTNLFYQKDASR